MSPPLPPFNFGSCSFGHDSYFMTESEDRNKVQTLNQELFLSTFDYIRAEPHPQFYSYEGSPIHQSFSILPSVINQTQRHFSSSVSSSQSSPTWSVCFIFPWWRSCPLISVNSHLTANFSGAFWWSWVKIVNRISLSIKIKDETLKLPNRLSMAHAKRMTK